MVKLAVCTNTIYTYGKHTTTDKYSYQKKNQPINNSTLKHRIQNIEKMATDTYRKYTTNESIHRLKD